MERQVCLTIPFALMFVLARPAHINRVSPDSLHSRLSKVELKVERVCCCCMASFECVCWIQLRRSK